MRRRDEIFHGTGEKRELHIGDVRRSSTPKRQPAGSPCEGLAGRLGTWCRRQNHSASAIAMSTLLACAGPPRPMPPGVDLAPTPWCFPLVLVAGWLDVDAAACSSERWACVNARDVALWIGRAAGIVAVGECGYR